MIQKKLVATLSGATFVFEQMKQNAPLDFHRPLLDLNHADMSFEGRRLRLKNRDVALRIVTVSNLKRSII